MATVQVKTTVGPDGVLSLHIPLGEQQANHDVLVTIQSPNGSTGDLVSLSWPQFVERTYGSCVGTELERFPADDFEQREPLD